MKKLIPSILAFILILAGGFYLATKLANHMHEASKNLENLADLKNIETRNSIPDKNSQESLFIEGRVKGDFKTSQSLKKDFGKIVNFYVKNNGDGEIIFSVKGYGEKTLKSGKEDFIQINLEKDEKLKFSIKNIDKEEVRANYRIKQK